MADKIQLRGDTAANWAATDPVLSIREIGFLLDVNNKTIGQKIGDGVKKWSELELLEFGGASGGGSAYLLTISENPTYNPDGSVKTMKQAYVDDPTKYYEQRFEYTNGLASKIEIKDDMNAKWVSHNNIYNGNGQLQTPTIANITAWTII